jgi:heme-degrading monooxygenase HmoA
MAEATAILRKWSAHIRGAQQDEYVAYVIRTGADDYATTPGNLGWQILLRSVDAETTEITTLSWWASLAAIEAFAGTPPDVARYYPEDDQYLLTRPAHVEHHQVILSQVALTIRPRELDRNELADRN